MSKLSSALLAAFVILGLSCGRQSSERSTTEEVPAEFYDMHNARISLDYVGSYQGVLPCADCEGIRTEVILLDESQFIRKTQYIGQDDMVFEESGIYTWDDAGNIITLQGTEKPNQYFVSENRIFHLDIDGDRIEGELADQYILVKQ
ncbi:MAG: copper resistance protein NlpE [Bacteroidales bacterium]|nr:copper resistance protein NlpE [Bacteroidales bacterium]